MKKIIYFNYLLNILLPVISLSQQYYPANVKKPIFWLSAEKEKDQIVVKEKINNVFFNFKKNEGRDEINNNPVFYFNAALDSLNILLNKKQASNLSLFVVYKNNEEEEVLWTLSDDESNKITATNTRIIDFTNFQHRNYTKRKKENIEIYYYQHNKKIGEENKYILNFGSKKNFPPDNFSGNIAEIILYDRVLSLIERQQVASFLSIKYGVSLSQFEYGNYYNSKSQKIWNYQEHKEFNQNITAIGKDVKGLIEQLTSMNSNDEGIVKMMLDNRKGKQIPDNYFVFWSDNGKDLKVKKQKEGQPMGISRIWLLDYEKVDGVSLLSRFDLHKLKGEKGNYYWLVLDTMNGHFSPKSTSYFKLGETSLEKVYDFKNWRSSEKQIAYSFWVAPEMFAHLDIQNPKCSTPYSGKIEFNIIGGRAPYRISILDKEQKHLKDSWLQNSSSESKNINLDSGSYTYQIIDAQNRKYTQDLYLSDSDIILPKINSEYIIKEPIVINPYEDETSGNYSYEWFRNEKLVSVSSKFVLSKSGDYEFRAKTKRGCHLAVRFKAFSIDEMENTLESKIILFPNPSKNGFFSIQASFPKKVDGNLSIFDLSGQLVKVENFYNRMNYDYSGHISQKGIYVIVVKTNLGENSYKLIVE
ncbi:T9SS type A sorting domain-containing protein [Ornithobacterium rhinotracheale]|uniref:T9SS type A sorting domain-containing protein n=1 Tax=Ornithobacterium rhinotracheale TaxID=28251 RepID=UPI001FF22D3A|nr:T9SS type A sorting domain-containing protein [Ornithobacterium rhinotracheale]MCK0202727.1 T9SS type A sorting domain-containing protein [Ornithobacterium rhinotracheale]